MSTLDYEDVYSQESFGADGSFGIKIQLALGRPLTTADMTEIYRFVPQLVEAIRTNGVQTDPKRIEARAQQRREILDLFPAPIYVEEIPNEYCRQWCCSDRPWFVVTTPIGRVKIGWRKRVINIDWSESSLKEKAVELFPDEETTRVDQLIHAWDYERARAYIQTLLGMPI